MKAYIFTKYESDERELVLEKKVIVSNLPRFEIMKLDNIGSYDWEECDVEFQPERLSPEDIRKNEDEIIRKIMRENPSYYDPDADDPLVFDKNLRRLSHQEIMNICDSPNTTNK